MTSDLPEKIGRYEIRKELGRGTMGVVYEAHDPALGRTIALKTIELVFSVSPEAREAFEKRFFAEARIAARLTHPGIVVVHDVGRDQDSGRLFIALEHLKGRTLGEVIKLAPIEWREALHITARVAEALHHAHSQGVIHRDIKPANIMLLPSGEPKILDFGIAKIETARIKLTATGQFFGTPLYMAPEQALGRKVDPRTDLFSLGAIAYTLLTGRLAFNAENIPRIISRILNEDPTPPSQIVRDLSPDVDYLSARALAKAPEDRHPDGKALAEDVEDVLAGRPPRHRAGWTPPRRAEGTFAAPTFPKEPEDAEIDQLLEELTPADLPPASHPSELESQLATLSSAPAERSPAGAGTGQPSAAPAPHAAPPKVPSATARSASPPAKGTGARAWLVAILFLAVLAAWAVQRPPPPGRAPELTPSSAPGLSQPSARSSEPDAARGRPDKPEAGSRSVAARAGDQPTAKPSPSKPAARSAQLAIDFEHPLKTGTVRIWVDDALVLEEDLEGRVTKKLVGIKIRKGRIEDLLEVSPGKHEVRVQVAWDDNLKEDSLSGTFRTGSTRHLEIRLGQIRKNLSLEWK